MTFGPADWLALGEIVWINALLSGDNAVVIAMACRSLPKTQRKAGMLLGASAAVVLRVLFTIVVAALLAVPFLKAAGAIALLWIAIDLLRPKAEEGDGVEAPGGLLRAVGTIAAADVAMSLDNVVAIAGVAGDRFELLVAGLVISIPMIVAGSAVILAVLDRLPILVWAGAGLLGAVAGQMFVSDAALAAWFGSHLSRLWTSGVEAAFAALVVGAGLVLWRGGGRARDAAN